MHGLLQGIRVGECFERQLLCPANISGRSILFPPVGWMVSATNGAGSSVSVTSLHTISFSNNISLQASVPQGYVPIAAKGHKKYVYALAKNENRTLLGECSHVLQS
nr:hypothetical protein [Tanacetum cinerariifolium]